MPDGLTALVDVNAPYLEVDFDGSMTSLMRGQSVGHPIHQTGHSGFVVSTTFERSLFE